MTFFHSVEGIFSVYIIIVIGYFLTKKGIFDTGTCGQFAWLVANVAFPLIFRFAGAVYVGKHI